MRKPLVVELAVIAGIIVLLAAGQYVYTRYISPPSWWSVTWDEMRKDLFHAAPKHQGAVIIAGDSNVERGNWDEHLLGVVNRGIGGDTTAGLLARLDEIESHDPRLVVIMIGNNDITRVPEDESVANAEQILKRLRERAIVVGALPRDTTLRSAKTGQTNDQIRSYDLRIKSLAEKYGARYVDVFDMLLDGQGQLAGKYHCGDGNHLSGEGYKLIADALRPLIQ